MFLGTKQRDIKKCTVYLFVFVYPATPVLPLMGAIPGVQIHTALFARHAQAISTYFAAQVILFKNLFVVVLDTHGNIVFAQ